MSTHWGGVCAALVAVIFAFAAYLQSQVLINHDVGYVVHAAGWLLEGMRFGHEIVEPNPPLIYYLSMPAAALAKWTALDEAGGMRAVVFFICAISLLLSDRALLAMRGAGRDLESRAIIVFAAVVLCLLPGRAFAQREHLAFAMTLPYILATGSRLDFSAELPRRLAIAIGAFAALGVALKPYFLCVPLAVELVVVARMRRPQSMFRPETWTAAAVLVIYAISIPLLAGDYLDITVPLAKPIYWAFEDLPTSALWQGLDVVRYPLLFAMLFALLARSVSQRYLTMVAAAAGYLASYFLQFKGYDYHRLPAICGVFMLFAIAAGDLLNRFREHSDRLGAVTVRSTAALVFGLGALGSLGAVDIVVNWYRAFNVTDGPAAQPRIALIHAVNQLTRGGHDRIYAFSTHPYPGFPTVNYVHAEWASRMHSQWVIPAMLKRDSLADPVLRAAVDRAAIVQRDIVVEDFRRFQPTLVLVDAAPWRHAIGNIPFDDIAYFRTDPRFDALWRDYRELGTIGAVRVFRKSDALANVP